MVNLYRIYMDDSGNVDSHTTNASDVRYGSVTAVILADSYLTARFNSSFEALSAKHFGRNEDGSCHNLHRRVLTKPPAQGPFSGLSDPEKMAAWQTDALRMFESADYTVITACVDKAHWYYRFPEWNGDFYAVLVEAVLERCFYYLKNRDAIAEVNIEQKNPKADTRIGSAFRGAMENGFQYIPANSVRKRFTSVELNVLSKSACRPGLQLADLLAGPALQHVRFLHTGRHSVTGYAQEIGKILEDKKLYREEGRGPAGFGRVWRPQN